MTRRSGAGEFMIGMAIGGMAGIAIGLLVAPRTGEETRGVLVERGIELKERMLASQAGAAEGTPAVEQVQAPVNDILASLRAPVEGWVAQVRRTIDHALAQGRQEAERVERELQAEYTAQVRSGRSF